MFCYYFKGDRASLESTIQQVSLPLESALIDPLPKDLLPLAEARKMDLEMAVIMQVRSNEICNSQSVLFYFQTFHLCKGIDGNERRTFSSSNSSKRSHKSTIIMQKI